VASSIVRVAAALLLAVGIAAAGGLVGRGLVQMRLADRHVVVRGLAEREVKADLAVWPIRFVVTGDELAAAQAQIKAAEAEVRRFLEAGGLPAAAVAVAGFEVTDALANIYRTGPVASRFVITQTITARSAEVDRVAALAQRVGELAAAGVALAAESAPAYVFTKLNDVKPGMIAEATRAARTAAEQFARDAGSRVGAIRTASQGLFQILPRDEVPGLPEERQVQKRLRMVSTIEYYLAD
jgi:hypothetical protein